MDRCPRFVFGTDDLTLTISQRPWVPADSTVGGSRTAASGVPAAYIVRRDVLLDLVLRFHESEWTAMANLMAWGQSAQVITFYPDALDDATSWDCYLESPLPGTRFNPTRDAEMLRVFELPVTLRGSGTAVPWLPYFDLT